MIFGNNYDCNMMKKISLTISLYITFENDSISCQVNTQMCSVQGFLIAICFGVADPYTKRPKTMRVVGTLNTIIYIKQPFVSLSKNSLFTLSERVVSFFHRHRQSREKYDPS